MKRISKWLWITLLLSQTISATGEESKEVKLPIDNGYPYFITGTVFPDDQGQLELTIIPIYYYADRQRDTLWLQQFSYGITDRWQIYMSVIPYIIHRQPGLVRRKKVIKSDFWLEESGNGDMNFGTEYSWIYIKDSTWNAAVTFDVTIPTGDVNENLSDGLIYYTPTVMVSKDFIHNKWRTQLFTQVGLSFVQRGKHHADVTLDDPAAHYLILNSGIAERSEKINYSLEFNWMTNTWNHRGNDNEFYITPGIYAYVRKDVALGLGVPIGLTQDSAKYQIIANLFLDIDTIFSKKKEADKKETSGNSKDKKSKINMNTSDTISQSNVPESAPTINS